MKLLIEVLVLNYFMFSCSLREPSAQVPKNITPNRLPIVSEPLNTTETQWKVDDIAIADTVEFFLSGHNLQTNETFISVYDKDFHKKYNRPYLSKNFSNLHGQRRWCMCLEECGKIGLGVDNHLRCYDTKRETFYREVKLNYCPSGACFYQGNIYTSSFSSNTLKVISPKSIELKEIVLWDIELDYPSDVDIRLDTIYICTGIKGRALSFAINGMKKKEYKPFGDENSTATSICLHERSELVFVLWDKCRVSLYTKMSSQCLRFFEITTADKVRVSQGSRLLTVDTSIGSVEVYDVVSTPFPQSYKIRYSLDHISSNT